MKRVLVTGANGFIGNALCRRLLSDGYQVTAALRKTKLPIFQNICQTTVLGNIDGETDWSRAINGIDVVVHLAARVHVMDDKEADSLHAYRQVNVEGTRSLATQAARTGVKRFLFLSSVKVNGEERTKAYTEKDAPYPEDYYGISKFEAERQVEEIACQSGMEHVVIRPPLVYGPQVRANFLALMRLINRRIPLPFANVNNRRSFIFLDNLVDCILTCMTHPAASGQTYLVSDGRNVSTPELIRLIAAALKSPCLLLPFPQTWLKMTGKLCGKENAVNRLLGSLTVDISKAKQELGWTPPVSMESGLIETAKWLKSCRRS